MDMLEKCAAAMRGNRPRPAICGKGCEQCRAQIRAVLTALLEPTPEMIEAGSWHVSEYMGPHGDDSGTITRAAFQAMIRKALGE